MIPFRVLIVDDEPLARDRLRELLAAQPDVVLVGECRNGRSALAAIRAERPDLVLLDMQMPEMDGLAVLEALAPEERPAVVFVTAYDRYALQAFELHALDYLLKPFEDERFEEALARVRAQRERERLGALSERLLGLLRSLSTAPEPAEAGAPELLPDRIAVRTGTRLHLVDVADVDWVEGAGVYARLIVGQKAHLLRTSLNELEARLPAERFLRIHRSTIVNTDRIREVRPRTHGEYVLLLQDGTRLKVSRTYSDRLRAFVEQFR